MHCFVRVPLLAAALLAGAGSQSGAIAANATVEALQRTPVSLFTYGLDALEAAVNTYIGRSGTPAPSAVFTAPLAGRIADLATVLYDAKADTITVNLVKIDRLDGDAAPDEACRQAGDDIVDRQGVIVGIGKRYPHGLIERIGRGGGGNREG